MKHQYLFCKISIMTVLLIGSVLFSSCMESPKPLGPRDYQAEIEDAVKYTISDADVWKEEISKYEKRSRRNVSSDMWTDILFDPTGKWAYKEFEKNMVAFENKMSDLWQSDTSSTGFLHQLECMCAMDEYKGLADRVLQKYRNQDVILSEYKEVETSSDVRLWLVEELNTNIVFQFTLTPTDGDYAWLCEPRESSLLSYIKRGY